jgi:hypothetical protein
MPLPLGGRSSPITAPDVPAPVAAGNPEPRIGLPIVHVEPGGAVCGLEQIDPHAHVEGRIGAEWVEGFELVEPGECRKMLPSIESIELAVDASRAWAQARIGSEVEKLPG